MHNVTIVLSIMHSAAINDEMYNGHNFIQMGLITHWGRVTHKCVSKLTIIGSDNGLSPGRRQAIIWINAGILSIRTLGTNFSEILSKIHIFSFKKMYLKVSSEKWRPFCLGLNVIITHAISVNEKGPWKLLRKLYRVRIGPEIINIPHQSEIGFRRCHCPIGNWI